MNKFSLCFVLFYAVFGCEASDEFKCAPNETYKQDCNTCVCSGDGKTAICSQIACPLLDLTTTEPPLEQVESNNHVCTPNDVKMEDCNRCRCAANGIGWFCTRRACPPKAFKKRAVLKPRAECNPGDSWQSECNNCFCTDNGVPICTLMFCISQDDNLRAKRAVEMCTPGTTWRNDCNTCFCGETGIAACTLKGCLKNSFHNIQIAGVRKVSQQEYDSLDFRCEPLKPFRLECNSCRCSPDGKTTSWCTKKRCVPGE